MLTRSHKIAKMIPNYIIGNYHLESFELSMAESITICSLDSQITQHVLGTGMCWFVDFSTKKLYIYTYTSNGYKLTKFELTNPVILEKVWFVYGEQYSDLGNFTWLSININIVFSELISRRTLA